MMRIRCQDAVIVAEQIGIDAGSLRRQQEALAEQENKVNVITDRMEHKEAAYRDRGKV